MNYNSHQLQRLFILTLCFTLVFAVPGWTGIQDLAKQVQTEAIKATKTADSGTVYNTGGVGLNFRDSAWGNIHRVLPEGTKLEIIGSEGNWSKVKVGDKTGYVYSSYVTKEEVAASNSSSATSTRYVNVRSSSYLNIRTGPWGQIIGRGHRGDKIEVIGREGDWNKVKYNGQTAYMYAKYMSGSKPSTSSSGTSTATNTPNTSNVPTTTNITGKGGVPLYGWLKEAGLTGETLRMAWSIAMGESGGNPRAFNGNARTGDKSYGLFQINMLGRLGPARLKQFGISSNEQLFDPMTNIRAMLKVSNNGKNWQPWSVYKHGTYKKYYNQFPPR